MLEEMTPEQFREWQDFYDLEPFGAAAQAMPIANVIATIAAAWGTSIDIDDQLRAWGHYRPTPPFDPERNAAAILAGFGG